MSETNKNVRKKKGKKTIDLTKNRTPNVVTKYIGNIRTECVRMLKESHIPVFKEMASDTAIVKNYFLNRSMNIGLLGENIKLFDRIFRYSVARVVTRDIKDAINNDKCCYPGIWTDEAIFSLILNMLNITTLVDSPEEGYFITVTPYNTRENTTEMVSSMSMPFAEYNPNRLYQLCLTLQNNVIECIVKHISNEKLTALLCINEIPLAMRYAREFGSILNTRLNIDELLSSDDVTELVNNQAQKFIDNVKTPLLLYLTTLLETSGLSVDAINKMLSFTMVTSYYSVQDDNRTRFIAEGNMIRYVFRYNKKNENESIFTSFTCDVMDLIKTVSWANAKEENTDFNAVRRVGKSLVKLFNQAVKYAIMIHIYEQNSTSPEEA